jgi:hypothetical protein
MFAIRIGRPRADNDPVQSGSQTRSYWMQHMGKNLDDGVFEVVRSPAERRLSYGPPGNGMSKNSSVDDAQPAGAPPQPCSGDQALIMFDDPVMSLAMARHLRRFGVSSSEARNVRDARSRIECERAPGLVVFECLACMGFEDEVGASPCRRASALGARVITVDTDSGVAAPPPPCRSPHEIRIVSGFSAERLGDLRECLGWSRAQERL